MDILVVSDSHGDFQNLQKLIERHTEIDTIVHLGDGAEEIWQLSLLYPQKQFHYVLGNNDLNCNEDIPAQQVVTIENSKILLVHGHLFAAGKRQKTLVKLAKSLGAQAVFYGHTHVFFHEIIDTVFVLNPGAVKYGRDKANRYAIVTVSENGQIKAESRLVNE